MASFLRVVYPALLRPHAVGGPRNPNHNPFRRAFSRAVDSVVNSFATSLCCELPIAVDATVRTLGYTNFNTSNGQEYSLDGMPTGTTYGKYFGFAYDGTTDANPVVLGFASRGEIGITYDPTDNTLWTSCYSCGAGVEH